MSAINVIQTDKGAVEYCMEGTGPVVMIVHGGHDSCRGDYMNQTLLDSRFTVLIPSRPGYGGTPIASGPTLESTTDLFASLLEKLGIDKVMLIGNSAGGPAALEFARRYPGKVSRLILEAAVVKPWFHRLTVQYYGVKYIFHPARQKKFWDSLNAKYRQNPEKTLIENLKLFTKLPPRDFLKTLSKEDSDKLVESLITGNVSGEGFYYDVEHRAKKIDEISCPTLIIHSKNDASVPFSHGKHAHKHITGSILYEAPSLSHFIYLGPGSKEVIAKRIEFLKAGVPN